ncbi:MAG: hypothetical protein QM662_17925 [Gordonia sp. (in: high G+C Gram-positive bacteria)]
MVLGVVISGIIQIATQRVPPAVANTSPVLFDYLYVSMQAGGALLIMVSVYIQRALLSLNVERVGGIALATAGYMYFAAVCINGPGLPISSGAWSVGMMSVYLTVRVLRQIPREIGDVVRAAERVAGYRRGQ